MLWEIVWHPETEDIETLDELERREIIKALNKYKGYKKDKDLVAKALGISRATLYRKLDKSKTEEVAFVNNENNKNQVLKRVIPCIS